ncbi:MAG: choice-of-anchor A family protein, partial [Oscillospiraceae bacterium]|nr:choice-of-anchor A family protein [Oscillospiraceae bacterium]
MTLQSSKKFLSGLTAMLLAVSSTIPSFASLPVQAKGETDASWIYAVNGAEETKKNPVELLVGVNNPAITGSTLQETMALANHHYALGIASQFCTFLENDMRVYDSDAEGRVAIGGDFYNYTGNFLLPPEDEESKALYGPEAYSPTDSEGFEKGGYSFDENGWSYNMGKGDYGSNTPLEMLEIEDGRTNSGYASVIINGDHTYVHRYEWYTPQEGAPHTRENNKTIDLEGTYTAGAARLMVSDHPKSDAVNVYNSGLLYTDRILDVQEQFDLLRTRSYMIAEQETEGAKIEAIDGDPHRLKCSYVGDEDLTTVYFNLSDEEFSLEDLEYIEFDVPEDAYVVVNVLDDNVKIRTDGVPIQTILNGKSIYNPKTPVRTDANGNSAPGTNVDCVLNNLPGTEKILYNLPNASTVQLNANFNGTICAPNADFEGFYDGTGFVPQRESGKYPNNGHLSGAIIAKSFTGTLEIGYRPFTGPYSMLGASQYSVNVRKVTGTDPLAGAVLTVFSVGEDGKPETDDDIAVGSVTSSGMKDAETNAVVSDVITFAPDMANESGRYYLKETASPAGYAFDRSIYYFTIEEKGGDGLTPFVTDTHIEKIYQRYVYVWDDEKALATGMTLDERKANVNESGEVYMTYDEMKAMLAELQSIDPAPNVRLQKFVWDKNVNEQEKRSQHVTECTITYQDGTQKTITLPDDDTNMEQNLGSLVGSDTELQHIAEVSFHVARIYSDPFSLNRRIDNTSLVLEPEKGVAEAGTASSSIELNLSAYLNDHYDAYKQFSVSYRLDPVISQILTINGAASCSAAEYSVDTETGEILISNGDAPLYTQPENAWDPVNLMTLSATLADIETIKRVAQENGIPEEYDYKSGTSYYKFAIRLENLKTIGMNGFEEYRFNVQEGYLAIPISKSYAQSMDRLEVQAQQEVPGGDPLNLVIFQRDNIQPNPVDTPYETEKFYPKKYWRVLSDGSSAEDADEIPYEEFFVGQIETDISDYVDATTEIIYTYYGTSPYEEEVGDPRAFPVTFDGTTGTTFVVNGFTDTASRNFKEATYEISNIVPDENHPNYSANATITCDGEAFTNLSDLGIPRFEFYHDDAWGENVWLATYLGDTLYPDLTLVDSENAFQFNNHKGAIAFKKLNQRGAALKGAQISMTQGSVKLDIRAVMSGMGFGGSYTVNRMDANYDDIKNEKAVATDIWSWSKQISATAIPMDSLAGLGSLTAQMAMGPGGGLQTPRNTTVSYYRIHEDAAPEGYDVTDDIIFFVLGNKVYSTTVGQGEMPETFPFEYSVAASGFGWAYSFVPAETTDETLLEGWTVQESVDADALTGAEAQTITLSMTDQPFPGTKLYLYKYDSKTAEMIRDGNVKLTLYAEDGDEPKALGSWNTEAVDENGYIRVFDDEAFIEANTVEGADGRYLRPGLYSIVEESAPTGYQLPTDNKFYFTVYPDFSIVMGKHFIYGITAEKKVENGAVRNDVWLTKDIYGNLMETGTVYNGTCGFGNISRIRFVTSEEAPQDKIFMSITVTNETGEAIALTDGDVWTSDKVSFSYDPNHHLYTISFSEPVGVTKLEIGPRDWGQPQEVYYVDFVTADFNAATERGTGYVYDSGSLPEGAVIENMLTPRSYIPASNSYTLSNNKGVSKLGIANHAVKQIRKVDENGELLEKAHLALWKLGEVSIDAVTSAVTGIPYETAPEAALMTWETGKPDTNPKILDTISDGLYQLVETQAPDSYRMADPILFMIAGGKIVDAQLMTQTTESDGVTKTTYVCGSENPAIAGDIITMTDRPSVVTVSKFDITNDTEISGAKLTISTTDENTKSLENVKLLQGNTDITENDDVTVAESEITWISTGEMISIQGLPNGTYYFQETGETFESDGVTYAIVESKYVFEIQDGELKSVKKSETGETVPSGKETDAKEGYVYSNNDMIYIGDARVPTVSKLTISKSDITGENELSGAKLTISVVENGSKSLEDVTLVQDIPEDSGITNVTNEAEDGTTEIAWTSNGYAVTLEGLPDGTYTFKESGDAPFTAADGITYTVIETEYEFVMSGGQLTSIRKIVEDGEDDSVPAQANPDASEGYVYATTGENGKITMCDAEYISKLTISKSDITGENELSGAKLSISVVENGSKSLEDVTLVQDIPEDSDITNVTNEAEDKANEITWTSNGYAVTLEGLPDGTYTFKESGDAPFTAANEKTYTVIETEYEFVMKDGKLDSIRKIVEDGEDDSVPTQANP